MRADAAAAIAATANPRVNPSFVAPVRLTAATLEMTEAPMEAPSSCEVLTIPEAIPASCEQCAGACRRDHDSDQSPSHV
jgi:hypothetical protein